MSKENSVEELDLVGEYLKVLGEGFLEGKAPDGTRVVSTPFRYVTGAQVEVAVWEEDGELWISDRGGLMEALLSEMGRTVFDEYLDTMFDLWQRGSCGGMYGVEFLGETLLLQTTEDRLGQDVATLVFALLETQAQAGFWAVEWWGGDVDDNW